MHALLEYLVSPLSSGALPAIGLSLRTAADCARLVRVFSKRHGWRAVVELAHLLSATDAARAATLRNTACCASSSAAWCRRWRSHPPPSPKWRSLLEHKKYERRPEYGETSTVKGCGPTRQY